MKTSRILNSTIRGGIISVESDGFVGKVGTQISLDYGQAVVVGTVIKKLGKFIKVRVEKMTAKETLE